MPNTPVKAPPVETLRPLEVNENDPEELPMVVDVPDVEDKVTLPDWFKLASVPVTPRVPPTVALPFEASVLNVPAAGVVPPIATLLIVPPVRVAPDEAKVFAVVGPFNETVPVPVLKVPVPVCRKFPVAERLVKFPADGVLPPITMPSIVPPVRVALDEEKLLAVVAPVNVFVLAPLWV
jgi:hypothetical protein